VKGPLANRFVLAILVILALGALFGLAGLSRHPVAFAAGAQPHPPARAAVAVAVRACPSPGSPGAASGGIAIATAPAAAGAGRAVVSRLSPAAGKAAAAPLHTLTQPGQLAVMKIREAPALPGKHQPRRAASGKSVATSPARGGVMVQAAGSMSQGLEVEQTGPGGLVTAPCEAPGTDFWFLGPGDSVAAHIQLYLMNVDSQPANAEVDFLAQGNGPLPGSDTGITVPAHGMVVQALNTLLHGSKVVALHVSASAGRLVAAVRETSSSAKPGGWLPVASAPGKRLVLPGLPGSSGTRELYVAVPGGGNAQVKLTAVTGKGSYQPTGGSGINLPGGSALGIALPSLAAIPAAIEISANVPVTAAMLVSGGASGAPGAITAGSGPVQQQGVIADNPGAAGSSELVLSAPRHAALVRISVATSKSGISGQAGRLVKVAAGHTVTVKIQPPRGSAKSAQLAVVITPQAGSGPVYAGRVISARGAVQSILPVLSSPTWVSLPPVRDSLTTVLP
jgi:hypothetical protein